MGSMTMEEIYRDRKKFSEVVFEVATSDLVNMGITVVSYTLKDIQDEDGYLKALGLVRTAEVKKDARIGEAEARRDAQIKVAIGRQEWMTSRLLNDTEIAEAKRDFELKKAAYDVEVQTKVIFLKSWIYFDTKTFQKAEAELAYELQAAKTKQRIKEENMQIKVIERSQEIAIQAQEIDRREKKLESSVRKPAEAEKFKLEKMAEAHK